MAVSQKAVIDVSRRNTPQRWPNAVLKDGRRLATYRYNAFGERVEKDAHEGLTLYRYDLYGHLLSETSAGSEPHRDYVWRGPIPVAQIDRGENDDAARPEQVFYLQTDGLGTPRIATNTRGRVVWRWNGGAFGATVPSGAPEADAHALTINLRFPGQYADRETRFFYNGARYYDPALGRYITSDPIGLAGGLNTYGYVGGNPTEYGDPEREDWRTWARPLCMVLNLCSGQQAQQDAGEPITIEPPPAQTTSQPYEPAGPRCAAGPPPAPPPEPITFPAPGAPLAPVEPVPFPIDPFLF